MSKFYGTVEGYTKTKGSKRCFKNIKVSAQSWTGSLITKLYYNDNTLMCELEHNKGSDTNGCNIYSGSLDNLVKILKGVKK